MDSPSSVNTVENVINIQNHDYQNGDILVYSYEPGSTPISGTFNNRSVSSNII